MGLFQARLERPPIRRASRSVMRPSCEVLWSRRSRSPRTSSPCRSCISLRSASMLTALAWTRLRDLAEAACAAAVRRSLWASSRTNSSAQARAALPRGQSSSDRTISAEVPSRSFSTAAGRVLSVRCSSSAVPARASRTACCRRDSASAACRTASSTRTAKLWATCRRWGPEEGAVLATASSAPVPSRTCCAMPGRATLTRCTSPAFSWASWALRALISARRTAAVRRARPTR